MLAFITTWRRRITRGLVGVVFVAACSDAGDADPPALGTIGSGRLQSRCDSALASTEAGHSEPVREDAFRPTVWRRFVLDDRVGRVDDVDWRPRPGVFVVLDAMNHQVVLLDTLGRLVRAFGREGGGPGEFDFAGRPAFAGNRLVVSGDSLILVTDLRGMKVFDPTGRYYRIVRADSLPESHNFDLHTAAGPDGTALMSTSGRFRLHSSDSLERTGLWIRQLAPAGTGAPRLIATADNPFARLPRFQRFPEHRPYRDVYRRTWDARGSHLAVYAWDHYGVCFFDISGDLAAAHGVGAPRLRVDAAEQSRVLREAFGTGTGPLPFVGVSAAELYRGKWPEYGPHYTDILMASEEESWVLRRANGGRLLIDVFALHGGYQGSFEPPDGRFPRRVNAGMAVSSRWDATVELTSYRLAPGSAATKLSPSIQAGRRERR